MNDDVILTGRIVAEYREMPGLSLTLGQAARLWSLEGAHVQRVLERLAREGTLRQTARGTYVLRSAQDS